MVGSGSWLARSDDAAGSCLQGGTTKPGACPDLPAGAQRAHPIGDATQSTSARIFAALWEASSGQLRFLGSRFRPVGWTGGERATLVHVSQVCGRAAFSAPISRLGRKAPASTGHTRAASGGYNRTQECRCAPDGNGGGLALTRWARQRSSRSAWAVDAYTCECLENVYRIPGQAYDCSRVFGV
jgi:hypothetical protein